ncbi:MAG: hypothetical protein GY856_34245 [bacterium]|nr:hypothetical protein [bacterium]
MRRISEATDHEVGEFQKTVESRLKGCLTLAGAAQRLTEIFYESYQKSVVLVRVFATVPFAEAPAPIRSFASDLATSKGITDPLRDDVPLLCLMGSRGVEKAWGDRRDSEGHVAIPLVSSVFVEAIPMMLRVMEDLGVTPELFDLADTDIITKAMGTTTRLFYVPDAKSTVDKQGRKIIAAQDFVAKYDVGTVFGVGAGYITGKTFFILIVFARENLEQDQAERFTPLAGPFKIATFNMISQGRVFA